MGLEKAIKHGKEHRQEYRGMKAIDKTTRNHGSDDWAVENRTYQNRKVKDRAKSQEREAAEESRWN